MKLLSFVMVGVAFLAGWLLSGAGTTRGDAGGQQLIELPSLPERIAFTNGAKASPSDRINESQIMVYGDKVVIDAQNMEWASFTDTHSMEPVIDKNSNALEMIPKNPSELKLGDIISYQAETDKYPIIHRIIFIGNDSEGWYATVKGDNNPVEDPVKVRFSMVKRVVVAIIY